HRIKSFYSSNLFVIDLIFTSSSIVSKFHRLETLILKNLESKYLGKILKYLTLLPHLFSLTIALVDCKSNKTTLYRQTFSLPVLKYCKLSYEECAEPESLLLIINKYITIEHMAIKNSFEFYELDALLTYVPQLRRFCGVIH
ncbi:unnamed protein product, partial [Rotaria sp. Silwood2]